MHIKYMNTDAGGQFLNSWNWGRQGPGSGIRWLSEDELDPANSRGSGICWLGLKGAGAVQGSSGYIDISKEVDEDILTVTDAPMRDMFVAPGEEEAASSNATGAVSTGAPVAGSAVTRKDSEPNEWTMSRYVPGKGIYFMAQTKEGAELFQEGLAGLSQAASMPAKVVGNVVGGVAGEVKLWAGRIAQAGYSLRG